MPNGPRTGRPHVLIVDDDADVRDSTKETLQRCGFDVLLAANAAQAIVICRTHVPPVDVLLTDLDMPGVSGNELARAVSASERAPRVVYM